MPVHPDLTAYRAVDACGGKYTNAQHLSGYAAGHMDALEAACKAVAKPDALMAEMLEVAKIFLGHDERFQVSVGGNPIAVDRMLDHCRAIVAKAESSPSTVGGR
jgi:hypothetical protein